MTIEILGDGDDALATLAATIREEYAASRQALGDAVEHYFACGAALLEARRLLPSDQAFGAWRDAQAFGFSQQWAHTLRQGAEYEGAVRKAVTSQLVTGKTPNFEKAVKQAVAVLGGGRITKPDVGGGVSHPARYSDAIVAKFAELLPPEQYPRVLDPFAGTGRIHELENETIGVELEPEWATLHPDTLHGDARAILHDWPAALTVDAIATSPSYGNRLADHHDASDPELRRSYTHDLGRPLTDGNSGAMQWGTEYRTFHEEVWWLAVQVLRPGGRFLLNIKDHVRDRQRQGVHLWHVATLGRWGLVEVAAYEVAARDMRAGENADARCEEWVVDLRKPDE